MKTSRITAAAAVAGASVVLMATPSFAHVSVQAEGQAAQGGYATVDFKVPNERDNASTTKVEINLPADHPLASVMTEPVPGWQAEVTRSKLDKPLELHGKQITEAVTKVTWTADGKGIEPGTFQKFPLSIGVLPEDTDQLAFKAIQMYSNKEVVRWIEVPQEGQEEPEKPAPVLQLSPAAAEDGQHDSKSAASSASGDQAGASADASDGSAGSTSGRQAAASSDSSDTTARALGIIGIVVGVAGLGFGVLAGRRRGNAGS